MVESSKPVVLITGVTSAIGLQLAGIFVDAGWVVVGTARGRRQSGQLQAMPEEVQIAEMANPRDLELVVKTLWRTYGRIDGLVCNETTMLVGPIDTLDYARMNEQLVINILTPAELARLVVPLMRRQGFGVIVGVSSLVGRMGLSGYGVNAASKFGLEGLFEALAMELAVSRIRVKLVEPGAEWLGSSTPTESAAVKVAKMVYRAATDSGARLRYPMGQTRMLSYARRVLPERIFLRMIKRSVTGN